MPRSRFSKAALAAAVAIPASAMSAQQQEIEEEATIEEIVVVGSHIRGAQITDALPVSIISEEDIEALGVQSGDELLEFVAEQGQNYFSESENISGGVNAARGDIGAFNLRNLGTGNTLVLLNGRRMVNSAAYQTEEVGGSFVPVNSVNSQSVSGISVRRIEILKDGASALYGADAVAGVVNYVLRDDFDGLRIGMRHDNYESLPRNDARATIEWGRMLNGGATRVGMFATYFSRGRVNSQDDPRWADSDFRYRVEDPEFQTTVFRNDSANSSFGQYDVVPSVSRTSLRNTITDSRGEFETYPAGHEKCQYPINIEVCGGVDGQGTYRYNNNQDRDLYSELERLNTYAYLEHDFDNGMQAFGEFTWYWSDTNTTRHSSTRLSAVAKFRMAADAYYNPLGPCGSPNRMPDSVIGDNVPCGGLELELDNYRFAQVPRVVDVDGNTYRFIGGLRGSWGDWDWEGAYTWSLAGRLDITHNRISNTLMTEALRDTTPAGFNPFAPYTGSNIERTLIDVHRRNEQELNMLDFKLSQVALFEMPAGPVGVLAGVEVRDEQFLDDRDPRLDGQIVFTDRTGNSYPFISDVANSSPTADSFGERRVVSVFGELAIPVIEGLDLQAAVRWEDFSDVGSTAVGKLAAGYRVIDQVMLRASWSEAFRAPNLITINESLVARSNTRQDYSCLYLDPAEDVLDCSYGMQRLAKGSRLLRPEESTNTSFGIVLEPIDGLTITYDRWSIEKTDTIGLFGEENHVALDLLMRLRAGADNCASLQGNPAVARNPEADEDYLPYFGPAGLCPFGEVVQVDDNYANLDTRTVAGHDVAVYFEFETGFGDFALRYAGSWLDEYQQEAGGQAAVLVAARDSGELPDSVPVVGFANLVRQDGNPEHKDSFRLGWNSGDWGVSVTGLRYGDFYQILSDGREFPIPSMATFNLSLTHDFHAFGANSRVRLGINNLTDRRAPLADDSFGYFADQHRDLGRYYYLDLRLDFRE